MFSNKVHNYISSFFALSIVKGGLSVAIPIMVSAWLFFYYLPWLLSELTEKQSIQAALFVSLVGLINNNNFGINQFVIYGLANKVLPTRYIFYASLFLVIVTLLLLHFLMPFFDGGLNFSSMLYLLFCIVSLSNLQRAIFESQNAFFMSMLCKLFFNGFLCVLFLLSFQKNWPLETITLFYLSIFLFFSYLSFIFFHGISREGTSNFSLEKYFSFLLVFLLIVVFFYFDRFVKLALDNSYFAIYVIQFEQLMKLTLPVNIGIMVMFPYFSIKRSFMKELFKKESVAFFLFVIGYVLVSPVIYNFLIVLSGVNSDTVKMEHFNVLIATGSIATFLICVQLTGLFSKSNTLFFFVVVLPCILTTLACAFFSVTLIISLLFKTIVVVISTIFFICISNKRFF